MQARIPSFDIFRGRFPETDVLWIETVEGLAAAVERMKEIATENPGPYFVFSLHQHAVHATIDTTPLPDAGDQKRSDGAA